MFLPGEDIGCINLSFSVTYSLETGSLRVSSCVNCGELILIVPFGKPWILCLNSGRNCPWFHRGHPEDYRSSNMLYKWKK